jgi:hypothetical protein
MSLAFADSLGLCTPTENTVSDSVYMHNKISQETHLELQTSAAKDVHTNGNLLLLW